MNCNTYTKITKGNSFDQSSICSASRAPN